MDVYSPFPAVCGDDFVAAGANICVEPAELGRDYDCIIAQHNILAVILASHLPYVPMVYVSHGVLVPEALLEFPPDKPVNISRYVAVSQEVADNLVALGIDPSRISIVPNFVDTQRFCPVEPVNSRLGRVFFMSNRGFDKVRARLSRACKLLGAELLTLGQFKVASDVEKYINRSDLVVSLGRGILEGMSCGRAAFVYGYRGGDGMVRPENIDAVSRHNFSGRCFGHDYQIDELVEQLGSYQPEMGPVNRRMILERFNVETAAESILEICACAMEEFSYQRVDFSCDREKERIAKERRIERLLPCHTRRRAIMKKIKAGIRGRL